MKRWALVTLGCILSGVPAHAESLAGYFLRFVRNEGIFESFTYLVYVFCGLGSFYNLVQVFQKITEGDETGSRQARSWALSLLFIAVCTSFISSMVEDSRTMAQINIGESIAQTTTGMNGLYDVILKLVYVTCGIIGLMVLPGKFKAMQEGDREAGRSLTNWGLSIISLAVLAFTIHQFFFL